MVRTFCVKTTRALAVTAALLTSSGSLATSATYGFGGGAGACSFWNMLLPITIQQPNDEPAEYQFNVMWVADDGVTGMDEYYDFFTTPYGQDGWPAGVAVGTDTPFCIGDTECVTPGIGYVGGGISAYKTLLQEFGDKLKVESGQPWGDGRLYWIYLPVRKLKMLRIEVFNPYQGGVGVHKGFVEPISFEYRPSGNGKSQLKKVDQKSTAKNQSFISLPDLFDPVKTSDIQVWFQRTDKALALQGITPKAHIDPLTAEQQKRIPAGCL